MSSSQHIVDSGLCRRVTGLCSAFALLLVVVTSFPEARAARPQIATQHLNISFEMGKDAVLTCTIRDIGKKRVIWRRLSDPFPISVSTTLFSSTNKYRVKRQGDDWRLTIRNIRLSDAGEYECRLSGPDDISEVISLIIPGAGETYIAPTNTSITASSGDTVVLPCHVQKIRKHLVLWQGEDRRVISLRKKVYIGDKRLRVQHGSREEWSLRINGVREKDYGVYTCVLNTDPPLTRSVTLRRPGGGDKVPEIGESLGSSPALIVDTFREQVDLKEGHTVTLTCQFTGNPTPTIRWSRRLVIDGASVTEKLGVEGEKYLLAGAKPSDSGTYICTATNGSPPPARGRIKVSVEEITTTTTTEPTTTTEFDPLEDALVAPRAYALEDVVYQKKGQDAELTCKGIGVPRPRVSWMLNRNPITNDWKRQVTETEHRHHTLQSTLRIRYVGPGDFAKYECFVYNRFGDDRTAVTLAEEL